MFPFPELLLGPVVSKAEGLPSTRPSRDCDVRVCRVSCPYPVPDHIHKLQTIFENLQFEHQIFDVDFQISALDPLIARDIGRSKESTGRLEFEILLILKLLQSVVDIVHEADFHMLDPTDVSIQCEACVSGDNWCVL